MSFFSDFFESVKLEDEKSKIRCSLVLGQSITIIGNAKIDVMDKNEIILKFKKDMVKIIGSDLIISSMTKGEFEIEGNVVGVFKL